MEKPFDSKITIEVGDRGEDVVTLPPGGLKIAGLAVALFLGCWLVGWLVGGAMAFRQAMKPSEPLSGRLFLWAWLGGWAMGVFFAVYMLSRVLRPMVGAERLAFDFDQVVHSWRLLGFTRTRRYPVAQVGAFEYRPQAHSGGSGSGWWGLCSMRVGKRRLAVGLAVTDVEAEWLVEQLNALLERRKR